MQKHYEADDIEAFSQDEESRLQLSAGLPFWHLQPAKDGGRLWQEQQRRLELPQEPFRRRAGNRPSPTATDCQAYMNLKTALKSHLKKRHTYLIPAPPQP